MFKGEGYFRSIICKKEIVSLLIKYWGDKNKIIEKVIMLRYKC